MYISVIMFFNIVIMTVTYELTSYPVQRMGIFASSVIQQKSLYFPFKGTMSDGFVNLSTCWY